MDFLDSLFSFIKPLGSLFSLRFLIAGFQQWYQGCLLFGETNFYM